MEANEKTAQITFKEADIHQLAIDIDEFAHDFDPYEYWNNVKDSETNIKSVETDIEKGSTDDIQAFLREAVSSYEGVHEFTNEHKRAEGLLQRLNDAVEFVKSKKETA